MRRCCLRAYFDVEKEGKSEARPVRLPPKDSGTSSSSESASSFVRSFAFDCREPTSIGARVAAGIDCAIAPALLGMVVIVLLLGAERDALGEPTCDEKD